MPKATVREMGRLKTLAAMEAFIDGLRGRDAANSEDGRGLIHYKVVPPKREGNDEMVMELWSLADLGPCLLEIPQGAVVEHVKADASQIGVAYDFVRIGNRECGVSVHLHAGMIGDQALVVSGNARLCLRTFHPKDADTRQGGRQAWKNYVFYVDMTLFADDSIKATRRIVIEDPSSPLYEEREEALLLGDGDEWATRSADFDPAKGRGINQHIKVVVFDPANMVNTAGSAKGATPDGVVATPSPRPTRGMTLADRLAAQGVTLTLN